MWSSKALRGGYKRTYMNVCKSKGKGYYYFYYDYRITSLEVVNLYMEKQTIKENKDKV